jgi:hypothetical protein|tara:strand:+ start:123 stop:1526 length:1404 start_codon:yes stop_codon:yes gene_type:complete
MSTIKVDKIEKRSGSTLTLGGACTAVTLAPGATQTGFGRTGTVDWCTTKKTSPFTAVSGDGFFVDTNLGAITVTLPSSPSAGDIVAFKDYANTWNCNAVTVCRNGSKINGACANSVLNTQSQSVTLIYVDGTKGWQDIHDSTANVTGAVFTSATGGCVTTSGNFKIHTFNADANFIVSQVGNDAGGSNKVSYMVVAGGGGGAGMTNQSSAGGGGGGAGGYREGKVSSGNGSDPYSASPLVAADGLAVTAATFPITVGGGGGPSSSPFDNPTTRGANGTASTFSSITSAGGGGGGARTTPPANATSGSAGGSGGGVGGVGCGIAAAAGNTPPVNPPQGNNGGTRSGSPQQAGGGGGGAGAVGGNGCGATNGAGGAGVTSSISASPVTRAGGGSGAGASGATAGGPGGGGAGGAFDPSPGAPIPGSPSRGANGTDNTGGGGGAGAGGETTHTLGGTGGSGVVVIRYKFQ